MVRLLTAGLWRRCEVADATAVRFPLPSRSLKVRWPASVVTPILAAILLCPAPAGAAAGAYLPPAHEAFQGVTGQPGSAYEQATGKHPAVYQVFSAWGSGCRPSSPTLTPPKRG